MKTAVREQRIISILESRGEMSVNELGAILNISVSTLRKQLADMQEKKLIIRTYGGVMSINPVPDETFDSKLHKNVNEKRRIATKARSLIKSGDSLSLGSGTTVYALSNLLDDLSSAEIYTNSMQAAEYLANWAILNTHICGGIIRSATGTIIGSEAYIDAMIDMGAKFAWFFTYMPVGQDAATELLATAEQREFMYRKIRAYRSTKPLFMAYHDGQPFNKNHLKHLGFTHSD